MAVIPINVEDQEIAKQELRKKWRESIDRKTMTFDRCLELAPLRALLIEHDKTQSNGGCLHIVTEDGNYEDSDIDYCIDSIESGRWREYHGEYVSEEDAINQLNIAKQLRELTKWEREMVNNGCAMEQALSIGRRS